MAYTKRTWVTGETVTADKLNNMETGINDIDERVTDLENNNGSGSSVTVDSAMSDTSTNPVQNKVVKGYIDESYNGLVERMNEAETTYYTKDKTYTKTEVDEKIASAATGGTVDLSNYVDKSSQQEITGEKTFRGNVNIAGPLVDKEAMYGTEGQILSSTGNGVKWIDAPTGGSVEQSKYIPKTGSFEVTTNKVYVKISNEIVMGEQYKIGEFSSTYDICIVKNSDNITLNFFNADGDNEFSTECSLVENDIYSFNFVLAMCGETYTSIKDNDVAYIVERLATFTEVQELKKDYQYYEQDGSLLINYKKKVHIYVTECDQDVITIQGDGQYDALEVGKVYTLSLYKYTGYSYPSDVNLNDLFQCAICYEDEQEQWRLDIVPVTFEPFLYAELNESAEQLNIYMTNGDNFGTDILTGKTIQPIDIELYVESATSVKATFKGIVRLV